MYGTDTIVKEDLVKRVEDEKVGKLCIHRNGQSIKPRLYTTTTGFGPDHNLGVYNNGVDAIGRALTERYFFCEDKQRGGFRRPYAPAHGAFTNKHFKGFRNSVMEHMPALPRLSRQQVVDRYTGSKKRVYTDAMHSLTRDELTDRDAHLKMFVKFEKQDLTKAPRGINPRDPRFNLELGRFLKHAEKPFFRAINKAMGSHAGHTVIKGLNAAASAAELRKKWQRFSDPVAIGLDAEKFDAHVSVAALLFEHWFYHAAFPGMRKKLDWLLKRQLKNVGKAYAADGKVKFSISGTRASGDLNTSLGNCLIMCACVESYARELGIDIELANNGDDCVVFMERADAAKFRARVSPWFRDRGFAMTVEPTVDCFEQVEFCQTRPVCIDGTWRMIRNHSAVFKKDPMCLISIPNPRTFRKWMFAVGTCGSILNSGVPVQQSFYGCFLTNGIKATQGMIEHINRGNSMLTRINGFSNSYAAVSASTRVSYYYAFGILPDIQIELERAFDRARVSDWESDPIPREMLVLQPGLKLLEDEIPW